MPQLKEINARGQIFSLHYTKGTVLSASKKYEALTSGSGGGQIGNQTTSVTIETKTIIHDYIHLGDNTGKEHSFHLTDFDVVCKEGNELAVVWVIKKGRGSGPYVLAYNGSTDQKFFDNQSISNIFKSFITSAGGCLTSLVIAVVVAWYLGDFIVSKTSHYNSSNMSLLLGIFLPPIVIVVVGWIYLSAKIQKRFLQLKTELNNIRFSDLK